MKLDRFDVLKNKDYSFIYQNDDLKDCVYLVLSGSYGYGTSIDGSDIDLRGFLIEQPKYIFGLENFEQYEDTKTDTVIYGLKKYVSLCVNANPNALELLGVDESEIVLLDERAKIIRDNYDMFLSKRVIHTFGNYATDQLRRFCNAICHDHYSDEDKQRHLADVLRNQIDHFNRTYTSFQENSINIYLNENNEILSDISLENYPLKDFIGIYSEMNSVMNSYKKMNHRNRKKDSNYLYKHAMHLVRILITGIDILDGKGIVTKRKNEHDLLMNIRNGKFSFDEIKEIAEEYQNKFAESSKRTKLPEKLDLDKIYKIMYSIYN